MLSPKQPSTLEVVDHQTTTDNEDKISSDKTSKKGKPKIVEKLQSAIHLPHLPHFTHKVESSSAEPLTPNIGTSHSKSEKINEGESLETNQEQQHAPSTLPSAAATDNFTNENVNAINEEASTSSRQNSTRRRSRILDTLQSAIPYLPHLPHFTNKTGDASNEVITELSTKDNESSLQQQIITTETATIETTSSPTQTPRINDTIKLTTSTAVIQKDIIQMGNKMPKSSTKISLLNRLLNWNSAGSSDKATDKSVTEIIDDINSGTNNTISAVKPSDFSKLYPEILKSQAYETINMYICLLFSLSVLLFCFRILRQFLQYLSASSVSSTSPFTPETSVYFSYFYVSYIKMDTIRFILEIILFFSCLHRVTAFVIGHIIRYKLSKTFYYTGRFDIHIGWISYRGIFDQNQIVVSHILWRNHPGFTQTPYLLFIKEMSISFRVYDVLSLVLFNKKSVKLEEVIIDGLEMFMERSETMKLTPSSKLGGMNVWYAVGKEESEENETSLKGFLKRVYNRNVNKMKNKVINSLSDGLSGINKHFTLKHPFITTTSSNINNNINNKLVNIDNETVEGTSASGTESVISDAESDSDEEEEDDEEKENTEKNEDGDGGNNNNNKNDDDVKHVMITTPSSPSIDTTTAHVPVQRHESSALSSHKHHNNSKVLVTTATTAAATAKTSSHSLFVSINPLSHFTSLLPFGVNSNSGKTSTKSSSVLPSISPSAITSASGSASSTHKMTIELNRFVLMNAKFHMLDLFVPKHVPASSMSDVEMDFVQLWYRDMVGSINSNNNSQSGGNGSTTSATAKATAPVTRRTSGNESHMTTPLSPQLTITSASASTATSICPSSLHVISERNNNDTTATNCSEDGAIATTPSPNSFSTSPLTPTTRVAANTIIYVNTNNNNNNSANTSIKPPPPNQPPSVRVLNNNTTNNTNDTNSERTTTAAVASFSSHSLSSLQSFSIPHHHQKQQQQSATSNNTINETSTTITSTTDDHNLTTSTSSITYYPLPLKEFSDKVKKGMEKAAKKQNPVSFNYLLSLAVKKFGEDVFTTRKQGILKNYLSSSVGSNNSSMSNTNSGGVNEIVVQQSAESVIVEPLSAISSFAVGDTITTESGTETTTTTITTTKTTIITDNN